MAKIQMFKGYEGKSSIPKPVERVQPNIVTVQDGLPVKYPGCEGIGVRVIHPTNPKAPSKNFGITVFYVPPHVILEPGSHPTEECYFILRGSGTMTLAGEKVAVKAGMFIHLPASLDRPANPGSSAALPVVTNTTPKASVVEVPATLPLAVMMRTEPIESLWSR